MGATLERAEGAIAGIIDRARSLHERLAASRASTGADDDVPVDAARLAAWCSVVTNGDAPSFERRLAWDGLDANTAARALVAPRESDNGVDAPSWGDTFSAAFSSPSSFPTASPTDLDRAYRADAPLPFEELLLPLVAVGRARVAERAGAAVQLVSDDAHAALERALLNRLTTICARPLYAEFSVYRACRQQAAFASFFGGGISLFAAFSDEMRGGGLSAFFEQYAVAARLCATVTDLWVDTIVELLSRLATDLPAVEVAFNGGARLGVVSAIRANMSDPHEGGRGVMILRWSCGLTVVYKPRPIGLETCFGNLVRWMNARSGGLHLRALAVVQRPTHGWIEYAHHAPCQGPDEAERYFERCGMLLCLAYVLNGSDFHYENLIAVGQHPVLIDMETLLGHRFELVERVADQTLAGHAARRQAVQSVLNVRLLPMLKISNGQAFEVGGLGGPGDAGGAGVQMTTVTYWKYPNTDAMKLDQAQLPMAPGGDNLPVVDGSRVEANEYVDAIVSGFTRAYCTLLAHSDALSSEDGPLSPFRSQPVRFILRNTSLYASALERCLHPRFLRDGVERGIQLDALSRVLLTLHPRPAVWPIIEAEHRALEQMDIPLFTAHADSTSLLLPTGVLVLDCFRTSAYDEVLVRVSRLSPSDLRTQSEIIRGSFSANMARDLFPLSCVMPCSDDLPARGDALPDAAVATACEIAEALRASSLGSEREVSWLGVSYLAEARRYMLGPMSSSLFDGYAGIAMFLAALERVTGGAGFRSLALSAAAPLRTRLDELTQTLRMRRSVDVGAATGLGSLIHALVRIGGFLDEPSMLRDAARLAAVVTPTSVEAEDALDVMSGSAGAILGLLSLHEAAPHDDALDLATAMATRLLSSRAVDPTTGLRTWLNRYGVAESGFAHGQAGIAYALSRLAQATGDTALRDAVLEAMANERIALGKDLAGAEALELTAAWSHGATGVGLARLGSLDAIGTDDVRAEIDLALALTQRHLQDGVDSLCCGIAGRVDFLVAAASHFQRPDLMAVARDQSGSLIARFRARGRFESGWAESEAWHVGLFHGAPGVSYTVLRVCHPTILPSILLWS